MIYKIPKCCNIFQIMNPTNTNTPNLTNKTTAIIANTDPIVFFSNLSVIFLLSFNDCFSLLVLGSGCKDLTSGFTCHSKPNGAFLYSYSHLTLVINRSLFGRFYSANPEPNTKSFDYMIVFSVARTPASLSLIS